MTLHRRGDRFVTFPRRCLTARPMRWAPPTPSTGFFAVRMRGVPWSGAGILSGGLALSCCPTPPRQHAGAGEGKRRQSQFRRFLDRGTLSLDRRQVRDVDHPVAHYHAATISPSPRSRCRFSRLLTFSACSRPSNIRVGIPSGPLLPCLHPPLSVGSGCFRQRRPSSNSMVLRALLQLMPVLALNRGPRLFSILGTAFCSGTSPSTCCGHLPAGDRVNFIVVAALAAGSPGDELGAQQPPHI